jgi:uncharacterized protein YciW
MKGPDIMKADLLNHLAGIGSNTALARVRNFRPEFVTGAELCRNAVLEPEAEVGLGRPLRAALAARMAQANAHTELAGYYREQLALVSTDPDMVIIADGGYPDAVDARLRAILRHTDLITIAPRACTRADTERLVNQGVVTPEVVALTELIGFLNFEVRVLATLDLLKA